MPRQRKAEIKLPKSEESLAQIRRLVNLVATQMVIGRIEKLAWTEKQKAIWVLSSGEFTRKQLAQKSGAHLNTVKSFIEEAMTYGLLEEEKARGGHPRRVIDYVPSEWKSYIKKGKAIRESEKMETTQVKLDEKQG